MNHKLSNDIKIVNIPRNNDRKCFRKLTLYGFFIEIMVKYFLNLFSGKLICPMWVKKMSPTPIIKKKGSLDEIVTLCQSLVLECHQPRRNRNIIPQVHDI